MAATYTVNYDKKGGITSITITHDTVTWTLDHPKKGDKVRFAAPAEAHFDKVDIELDGEPSDELFDKPTPVATNEDHEIVSAAGGAHRTWTFWPTGLVDPVPPNPGSINVGG